MMQDPKLEKDDQSPPADSSSDSAIVTLTGTVEKIIPPFVKRKPEKAQIVLDEAKNVYRTIRFEITPKDPEGNAVGHGEGAKVEVTIEGESDSTKPKK